MDEPARLIYVLKDGARIGPFTLDDLLDLVESGDLSYEDACLRAGAVQCERVRDVLDWDEPTAVSRPAKPSPVEDPTDEEDQDPDQDDTPEDEEEEEADDDEWEDDLEEDADDNDDDASGPRLSPRRRRGPAPPPRDPRLILYLGHPSVLSFPGALLLIAAALGGGIWARDHSPWWLLAGLLVALFAVSWILFQRSLSLYVVTPRRVEVVTGFLAKSSNEVRIEDIRAINVRRPGFRGLLGVGTVEFASAGGAEIDVAFTDIYAAHRVKGLVRRLQDAGEGE